MAEFTTMENIQCRESAQSGVTVRYGEHVIHSDYLWGYGYYCQVYEFIDDLEEFDEAEARLNLIASKDGFEDGGHAIQWGLTVK